MCLKVMRLTNDRVLRVSGRGCTVPGCCGVMAVCSLPMPTAVPAAGSSDPNIHAFQLLLAK